MISALMSFVLAWNAEYAGFVHFHNWDFRANDISSTSHMALPSGGLFPANLAAAICTADSACNSFDIEPDLGQNAFRTMNFNQSMDMYLANDTAIVPASYCKVESLWLACDNDGYFQAGQVIASFALPPDLVHSSCVQNPHCVGFTVSNLGTYGTLFQRGDANFHKGYFALPSPST